MQPLKRFHLFTKLPPELRDTVWKFHRERRGLRHYLVVSGDTRFYAAIDIETHSFAQTDLPHSKGSNDFDAIGCPLDDGKDYRIRLVGLSSTPESGEAAKSPVTSTSSTTWETKRQSAYVRINYDRDVVFFGGDVRCFEPLVSLRHRKSDYYFSDTHWLTNIRRMAIRICEDGNIRNCDERNMCLNMPKLRALYLINYRDPKCPYGAPRTWVGFKKEELDDQGFLPITTFTLRLPNRPHVKYQCNMDTHFLDRIKISLRNGFIPASNVSMSLVADPY